MSFRGIFALVLEACLLIMVMGTEIKEFLIAAVCLGGLLVLSLISVLWAIIFLRFSSVAPNPSCERGKDINFTLTIKGVLPFPVVCKIAVLTPYKGKPSFTAPIYSNFALNVFRFRRTFNITINCPHSGHWSIGIRRLKITDIFGFFAVPLLLTSKKNRTTQISVTPKFYPQTTNEEVVGGIDNYSGLSFGNSELGEVFEDNRAYRYGDPLRRINWKQSAKLGKPITRLYEKPKKSRVIIALDSYTTENYGQCDDAYRETALYIAEHFASNKNDATVCLLRPEGIGWEYNCNDITELNNLGLELADLSFKKDLSPLTNAPLKDFEIEDRDLVYIITSNPNPSLISALDTMNNQGLNVTVIMPKSSAVTETMSSDYLVLLDGSEEIPRKVGAVL